MPYAFMLCWRGFAISAYLIWLNSNFLAAIRIEQSQGTDCIPIAIGTAPSLVVDLPLLHCAFEPLQLTDIQTI